MSQTSDDTKLLNSWSRTPGKQPTSSSYYHQGKYISSSSESSGIGRTPNWNSDSETKFPMLDSTSPWSTNSNAECSKKLSWDDTSPSCRGPNNNTTFGFSSQWTNSMNNSWGMPQNTNNDFRPSHDTNTVDQYWNNTVMDGGTDHILSQNNNIWSSSSQKPTDLLNSGASAEVENVNSSINQSILHSENDNPNFSLRAFNNSNVDESSTFTICDYSSGQDTNSSAQDKSSDTKTWAQAAGKGLSKKQSSDEERRKSDVGDAYRAVIDRITGWCNQNVDQSTPWVMDDSNSNSGTDKIGVNQRNRVESNVWTNEPPNGVGIWETHYESLGDKNSRWNKNSNTKIVKPGWEMDVSCTMNSQWNEREDTTMSTWNTNSIGRQQPPQRTKQSWSGMGPIQSGIQKQIPPHSVNSMQQPIGTGMRNQMYPAQRNPNVAAAAAGIGAMPGNVPNDISMNRSVYYRDFNRTHNQQQHLMNVRNDWNMPPVPGPGPGPGQGQESFRPNPVESEQGGIIPCGATAAVAAACGNNSGKNGSYNIPQNNNNNQMPVNQMISTNNSHPAFKNHMMQQMAMVNRHSIENNPIFDKQIMNELQQLVSKKRELLNRISSMQNVVGSQAIIQEVTRTLNEVEQQIVVKEQTIKVRSQFNVGSNQLPNGLVNTGSHGLNQLMNINPRNLPHSAAYNQAHNQSAINDITGQMTDIKLQKGRLDLWSQGNMPSNSNTISPFYGLENNKPGVFFNANNVNNSTPQLSQHSLIGNTMPNRTIASQNNFLPTHRQMGVAPHFQHPQTPPHFQHPQTPPHQHHPQQHIRSAGQGWPSRIMQNNSNYFAQTSAFNSPIDNVSQTINLGPNEESCFTPGEVGSSNLGDSMSSANTSSLALSLPQNLSSTSLNNNVVSSAFNSRDVSASISEFVPGQPWTGVSFSQQEDPNLTLGAGSRSLLTINNEHLEKLANSRSSSVLNETATISNNLPLGINGVISGRGSSFYNTGGTSSINNGNNCNGSGCGGNAVYTNYSNTSSVPSTAASVMTTAAVTPNIGSNYTHSSTAGNYVLIRQLPAHINTDMLRSVINAQKFPGLIQMHPNMMMKNVLLHFNSNEEAAKAYNNLYGKVGIVEIISEQEVNQFVN